MPAPDSTRGIDADDPPGAGRPPDEGTWHVRRATAAPAAGWCCNQARGADFVQAAGAGADRDRDRDRDESCEGKRPGLAPLSASSRGHAARTAHTAPSPAEAHDRGDGAAEPRSPRGTDPEGAGP